LELNVNGKKNVSKADVKFRNYNEPLQGHLSLTNNNREMRIMWTTQIEAKGVVYYGTEIGKYTTATSNTSTYSHKDMCDSPANKIENFIDPGVIHDAVMTGLSSGKLYYYMFGSDDNLSPIYSFVAPPSSNTDVEGVIYGDMGVGTLFSTTIENQQMALRTSPLVYESIQSSPTPFVFHIGDISYARGYSFLWEFFFNQIQPIATRAPYMVLIGNHEWDYPDQDFKPDWADYGIDSGGECGVPYFKRFHMPDSTSGEKLGLWYSFNYGPIHFTVMSSEHDFLQGSEQYEWLKKDLENVDRAKTPWVVFTGHRPFYTSTDQDPKERDTLEHLRAALEPIVVKNKVDVCFWGHVHHYERTCHYTNNECLDQGDAPVHIVIGNAGNSFQVPYISMPNKNHYDQPNWVLFRTANFGFGRFYSNSTHFKFQLVGISNQVHDEFILTK